MPSRTDLTPARASLLKRQGLAIGEARRGAGLTQHAAAEALGVALGTLRAWEIGLRACPLGQRRRIADLWGGDPVVLDTAAASCPHCGRPYPDRPGPARRSAK